MPRAAPSACQVPMCVELCTQGAVCATHRQEAAAEYRLTETTDRVALNKFYQGRVWRALSQSFRRRHPVCLHCMRKGRTTPCDMVDHIVPVRVEWGLRHDPQNLQALCHPCHNAKTRQDRGRRS